MAKDIIEYSDSEIKDLKTKLEKEPLFTDYLKPAITGKGKDNNKVDVDIFPSIKKDKIRFFYKGLILFWYRPGFGFTTPGGMTTALPRSTGKAVSQAEIRVHPDHKNYTFYDDFEDIKNNTKIRSKAYLDEKKELSKLYKYSCACKVKPDRVYKVLLDLEYNHIDFVLYDFSQVGGRKLRFYEAKTHNDPRIVSNGGKDLIDQVDKYAKFLKNSDKKVIKHYTKLVNIIGILFKPNTTLEPPQLVDPDSRISIVILGSPLPDLTPIKAAGIKTITVPNLVSIENINSIW
jgi:hypothetical protein